MVEKGATVTMHYTLKVDGKVVDSSSGREPMSFVYGSGHIVPGLETQLAGLKVGDRKAVTVQPEKGYGLKQLDGLGKVPKKTFAHLPDIQVGSVVRGESGGRAFQARVHALAEDTVTLDFNHPLAGKVLDFEVEIVSVAAG